MTNSISHFGLRNLRTEAQLLLNQLFSRGCAFPILAGMVLNDVELGGRGDSFSDSDSEERDGTEAFFIISTAIR